MQCDLCGKQDVLIGAFIEGVEMKVCNICSKLGTRINLPKQAIRNEILEVEEYIVEDFHSRIKEARELRNMKQEDAAKRLAIKESLMQKIENGNFTPSLELARRLERFFKITLIEEISSLNNTQNSVRSSNYTIADLMNG